MNQTNKSKTKSTTRI